LPQNCLEYAVVYRYPAGGFTLELDRDDDRHLANYVNKCD